MDWRTYRVIQTVELSCGGAPFRPSIRTIRHPRIPPPRNMTQKKHKHILSDISVKYTDERTNEIFN
jgi:hypothetical protein